MYHDNAEHIQVNVQHGGNNVCRPHSLVHVFLLNNLEILFVSNIKSVIILYR